MAKGSFFQDAVERVNQKQTVAPDVARMVTAYDKAISTPVLDSTKTEKKAFAPASSLEEFMGILPTSEMKNDGLDGTHVADTVRDEWAKYGVDNAEDYRPQQDWSLRGLKGGTVGAARDSVNYMGNVVQQSRAAQEAENAVAKAMYDGSGNGKTYEELYSQYIKEYTDKYKDEPLKKTVDWGEEYDAETERLAQELNVSDAAREQYEFNAAVGRMAPAIALSATGNIAGAGMAALGASAEAVQTAYTLAKVLSSTATFTSAAGNAYEDAKAHGIDDDRAMVYGATVGAIELATEAISSGLGKIGGKAIGTGGVTDKALETLARKISSDTGVQNAVMYVGGLLGEGFEEWLSEWGDYAANRLLVGYDTRTGKEVWDDSLDSFRQGVLMSALLNSTQLMQRGTSPKDAIRQGIDAAAQEYGIANSTANADTTASTAANTGNNVTPTPDITGNNVSANTVADILKNPVNRSQANKIINDANLRAEYEAYTGETLPSVKSEAAKAVMEYSRNHAELTPIAQVVLGQQTEQTVPQTVSTPTAQDAISPAAQAMAQAAQGNTGIVENPYSSGVYASTYTNEDGAAIRKDAKTFRNVIAGIDTTVKDFFSRWKNGRKSHLGDKLEKLYLGKVTDAARAKISSLLGYDVTSNDYIITSDGVKHVFDQHGDTTKEVSHGNIPLTDDIIEKLPEVLANPDSIELGHQEARGGRTGVVFKKAFPNGTIVYIQFDNSGRGTIEGKTIYAKKAATTSAVNANTSANTFTSATTEPVTATAGVSSADVQAPASTPETSTTAPVGTSTVTQPTANVNTESAGTPRFPSAPTDPNAPAKVSETVTTVRDSLATPEGVKQLINASIKDGGYHYFPITNDATVESAAARIREKGYIDALNEWTAAVRNGQAGAELAVTGQLLYDAAVKGGDTKLALDILSDYQTLGTNTAQGLQAMNLILSNLSPDGKLYMVEKTVGKLNESISEKTRTKAAKAAADKAGKVTEAAKAAQAKAIDQTADAIVDPKNVDIVFAHEYADEGAKMVERYVRSEIKSQLKPMKDPTSMEALVGTIKRFASKKFLDKTGKKNPTSVEMLTEYVQNQSFFDEVWNGAQQAFNNLNDSASREYAGQFTKERLLENSDSFLQRAVYESAIASDETTATIRKQAELMPAEEIVRHLADNLIAETGATGEIAAKIQNAALSYVNRVLEQDTGTSRESIVRNGMQELGKSFREIASKDNITKDQLRQDLADQIAIRYALDPATAQTISDNVIAEYDKQLSEAMGKEIERRFAPKEQKEIRESDVMQDIVEAINLGTFNSEYAQNAAEKLFGNGNVRLNEELVNNYIHAEDAKASDAAYKALVKDLAKQIPSNFAERWNALRYLNMLGNLRTQGRNLAGNTAMMLTAATKNTIRYGMERILEAATGGKYQRNTSFVVSPEMMKAARADYDTYADFVNGDAKYTNTITANKLAKDIQGERTIFQSDIPVVKQLAKVAEAHRKGTNWGMEKGDTLFIKPQYARYLAGYLEAHGMDAQTFSQIINGDITATAEQQNIIDSGRNFAAKEAQEATFHDTNALSSCLSKLGRGKNTPWYLKLAAEGLMPFRKTPANVAARAVEYSPAGFLDTVIKAAQWAQGKNGVNGADVVNSLAKSMTGTMLFALGSMLQRTGWIRATEDDEEKDAFEKMQGAQDWSLVLPNGASITIDWLSPAAIPMFMGALFADSTEDGFELSDLASSLTRLTDPMIEMSMLQGVNDAIEGIRYSENSLEQLAINFLMSYVTQGLTSTLLGQVERTFEDRRYSTFTSGEDDPMEKSFHRQLGKASAKTPGVDYNQVEYVDAWGRTEYTGNAFARAFENFLSPGYISRQNSTEVDDELMRLYDAGQTNVLPERIGMSEKIGVYDSRGNQVEQRYLTADEYVQFQKVMGQTSLEMVKDLMNSPMYDSMSDASRAAAISDIYGYAKNMARMTVEDSAKNALKTDVSQLSNPSAYYAAVASFATASKDSDNRNYQELNSLTATLGKLPKDVQTAVLETKPELGKLIDARENGYTAQQYYDIKDSVSALTPAAGYTNVATWQKITEICSMNIPDEQKDYFTDNYFQGKVHDKYMEAREKGYSPYSVALAYQTKQLAEGVDANGDGKIDSGSKKAAFIEAMMSYGATRKSAEYFWNLF